MTYDATKLLVPLADAKVYLAVTDTAEDNLIGYLIQSVSDFFATYCDRQLIAGEITEYHQGKGHPTIYLGTYPVNTTQETTEVYTDVGRTFQADTRLDSDDIWIDQKTGQLTRIGRVFPIGTPIKVVYNGGYSTVPYDLRIATLEAVAMLRGRQANKRVDVTSMNRGESNYQFIDDYPETVKAVLQRYRRG